MKFSKHILLVVTIVITSMSYISYSSENEIESEIVNLLKQHKSVDEESISQRLQDFLIESYVYYLKTSGQVEIQSSIRMQYFPILSKNTFIDELQQPFHFEQYFSKLYDVIDQPITTTTVEKDRVIKISTLPVNRGFLSSRYGMRKDPINGLPKMHRGIDIATRYGAEVNPIGNGIVIYAGYKLGYGNTVDIKHSKTVLTRYAHLKQFLVNVDQQVTTTDVIGFGSGTNTSRIAAVKTNANQRKLATVITKSGYPETNEFPQITYSDYVKSVDGLFGFSAPQSFTY